MDAEEFRRWQQAFWDALQARRLQDCAQLLSDARARPSTANERQWLAYFQAILCVESAPPRWDQAEKLLLPLLAATDETALLGRVLLELGINADMQGDCALAAEYDCRSLVLFEQLGDTLYQAKILKNLGIAYRRGYELGQFGTDALDQALACQRRSLQLCPPGEAWLASTIRQALGAIHKALGQYDEALAHYTAKADFCREHGHRYSLALTLNNLGEVYQLQGNWAAAVSSFQEALAILGKFDDYYERADVLANLASLRHAQGQLQPAQDTYDQAIALLESMRAVQYTESARLGFFSTETHVYEGKLRLCLETKQIAAAFDALERAKSRSFVELLKSGLAPQDYASLPAVQPLDLATVQSRLPQQALLLEYFVTAETAGVFLISRESAQVAPLPITLAGLRRAFAAGRQSLVHLTPDHNGLLHQPWPLDELYRLLIEPIAGRLAGQQLLCIVPHGPLHYVPFHALTSQVDGRRQYLLDSAPILYSPSAAVLLDHCLHKQPSGQTGGLVLAHGSPQPAAASPLGRAPLRYVEQEGRGVASILGGALYLGNEAQRAVIYQEAQRRRFLHFACHGRFDARFPLASGLELADGLLSAQEIQQGLRLDADLVVLSACESGQSALRRGDELIGLARAFMAAGAPSVLMSLWPVDDLSTRVLMEEFYRKLMAGVSKAEALRRAQRVVMASTEDEIEGRLIGYGLEKPAAEEEMQRLRRVAGRGYGGWIEEGRPFAHPYYWAPFFLMGDRLVD